MVSGLSLAAILAAAGLGAALPPKIGTTTGFNLESGRASIKQVRNPKFSHFSGPLSTYKTYLKYGAKVPEELVKAVHALAAEEEAAKAKRATGTAAAIPLDKARDIAWITPVTIGTPPQTLYLDFDTGSSDLWVFSSHLPTSQVRGQTLYTPGKSSTSKLLTDHTWRIQYGDGSRSSGNVYTDNFTVGGLMVEAQSIETAQSVSASFTEEAEMDGLLGLGFSTLNTVLPKRQLTFLDNIKPKLDKPVIGVDFRHHQEGTYDFGFIDPAKHTGPITYTPVNTDPGYWTFTAAGYAIGDNNFTTTTINGISDTGTTLVYLPSSIVSAYYRQVPGATTSTRGAGGGYTFPCSATLPTFTFAVGTTKFNIPGKYINYGPLTSGSQSCYGGIQSSSGLGVNIWGGVALKATFTVFDAGDKPQIGFANKVLT